MQLEVESAATGINAGLRSQFAPPLYLLTGIGGLILLVVCVNFANLTLARVAARRYEMSTRVALGASPRRIIGQLLTESLLLSFTGAVLALAFAYWGSQLLMALMTEGTPAPAVLDVRPDWRVFSFTAVAAVLTGLLIGLAPAWQMSRQEPASVLRRTERSLGRRIGTLGRALIITQIALSLVLLQGAGLFRRTLESLRSSDPGFQREGVLEVTLYPKPGGYSGLDIHEYRRQLTERIATVPGVLSVAFSQLRMPIGERGWKDAVSHVGPDSDASVNLVATLVAVSPGFFETLGVPLVSGRDFDWMDDDQHPRVAIIADNVARRLMPSGNEIGERIRFGVQPEFQDLEVVAVARSARLVDLRSADIPVVYVPLSQHPFSQRGNLLVRANDRTIVTRAVEKEVHSLGHEYSTGMKTLEQASEYALLHERTVAMLSSFFALAALILVGLGLFGLMSYAVTRRTGEIGIRMALGSQRGGILRMILGETLLLVMAGVAIGLPCAVVAARLVAHILFGLSPADPATLATVASMLIGVGVIAGYFPARRAMRMDPLVALRHE
jgi:predicted permease